eukprot:g1694.t1
MQESEKNAMKKKKNPNNSHEKGRTKHHHHCSSNRTLPKSGYLSSSIIGEKSFVISSDGAAISSSMIAEANEGAKRTVGDSSTRTISPKYHDVASNKTHHDNLQQPRSHYADHNNGDHHESRAPILSTEISPTNRNAAKTDLPNGTNAGSNNFSIYSFILPKTPLQELNELCQKLRVERPKANITEFPTKAKHERYNCSYQWDANHFTGKGHSKKEAAHLAASQLRDFILNNYEIPPSRHDLKRQEQAERRRLRQRNKQVHQNDCNNGASTGSNVVSLNVQQQQQQRAPGATTNQVPSASRNILSSEDDKAKYSQTRLNNNITPSPSTSSLNPSSPYTPLTQCHSKIPLGVSGSTVRSTLEQTHSTLDELTPQGPPPPQMYVHPNAVRMGADQQRVMRQNAAANDGVAAIPIPSSYPTVGPPVLAPTSPLLNCTATTGQQQRYQHELAGMTALPSTSSPRLSTSSPPLSFKVSSTSPSFASIEKMKNYPPNLTAMAEPYQNAFMTPMNMGNDAFRSESLMTLAARGKEKVHYHGNNNTGLATGALHHHDGNDVQNSSNLQFNVVPQFEYDLLFGLDLELSDLVGSNKGKGGPKGPFGHAEQEKDEGHESNKRCCKDGESSDH